MSDEVKGVADEIGDLSWTCTECGDSNYLWDYPPPSLVTCSCGAEFVYLQDELQSASLDESDDEEIARRQLQIDAMQHAATKVLDSNTYRAWQAVVNHYLRGERKQEDE